MPAVDGGLYKVQIKVGNKGYAQYGDGLLSAADHLINNAIAASSISPSTSTTDGNEFTVNGNGFTATTKLYLGSKENECFIISRSNTQITCITQSHAHSSSNEMELMVDDEL